MIKILLLLLALSQIPFFPNEMNVFACGFSSGVLVAILVKDMMSVRH